MRFVQKTEQNLFDSKVIVKFSVVWILDFQMANIMDRFKEI